MGGKNPAIVSRKADLEEAAEGIMRSAFGFGGQKCSANSRVYVERPVHDELVRLLVEKTEKITIGDPIHRENWLGPIIDQKAVDRHQQAVAEARRDGTVYIGGEHLTDGALARGFYVEPTVVGDLPAIHRLFQDELFAPFTAVHAVDSLDEALRLANDSIYGLTAGVYSEDPAEVAALPRRDRGGRPVRQPPRRRDDRRVAGRPGVRRLEGLRLDRQGRPVDVLRRASSSGSRATRSSTRAGMTDATASPKIDRTIQLRDGRTLAYSEWAILMDGWSCSSTAYPAPACSAPTRTRPSKRASASSPSTARVTDDRIRRRAGRSGNGPTTS